MRFGVAVSDETQILASPLTTLVRRPGKRFPMPRFLEIVATEAPVGVVVGHPLEPSGAAGDSAHAAEALARSVEERTGLPVALHDERVSTARALGVIREIGGTTRGRKEDVDALAASVILQHFLDSRRHQHPV